MSRVPQWIGFLWALAVAALVIGCGDSAPADGPGGDDEPPGTTDTGAPTPPTPDDDPDNDAPPDDDPPDNDPPDGEPPPDDEPPEPLDWRAAPIYLVMPDRFDNGNPANDQLGRTGCLDSENPRAYHGGDLAGLARRADYLAELGVGAVWSTPLYEQTRCGYHGYWADFRLEDEGPLEPRFGTADELTAAIDELHARGIRFVLDLVVNHAGYEATITRQRPGWFHAPSGCENPGPPVETCPLSRLPDFAQEIPEVAEYVTDLSTMWPQRFAIDGVRMDTAKHVPLNYFRDYWFDAMRAEIPDLFVVGEVWLEGSYNVFEPYYDAGFDGVFNFSLRRALVDVFARGQSTDGIANRVRDGISALGLERASYLVNFIDNHDMDRWGSELDGRSFDDAELQRRYWLALTALFTLPGVPQLYYGDELGLFGDGRANRNDMPAWAWSSQTRRGPQPEAFGDPGETFDVTRRLIEMRRRHPALYLGSFAELWRQNGNNAPLYAYFRSAGDDRIVVVINNGDGPVTQALNLAAHPGIADSDKAALPDGAVFEDALGRGAPARLAVRNGSLAIELPRKTAAVYVATPGTNAAAR